MNITQAQYCKEPITNEVVSISATIDDVMMSIPVSEGNRHYDEIMKQVEAGTLTIQEAE